MIKFKSQRENTKTPPQLTKSGFTIVEVLIAMVVLLVGVLGVIQLFPAGLNASKESKNETITSDLVQAKLEELKAMNYDDVSSEGRARVSTDQANPYYKFERQTVVSYVDTNLAPSVQDTGLKKIVITGFWPESGQEQSVSATLLKRK